MSATRPRLRLAAPLALLVASCGSPGPDSGPTLFFPPAPDAPRLQFLRSVDADMDIVEERSGLDTLLFGEQTVERALVTPYGVTLHDGVFYIADLVLGMIVTIDIPGKRFDAVRLEGRAAPKKPVNLAFAEDGRMFVADAGRRQVMVYDAEFQMLAELGPWGEESRPADVDVFGDRIYITDTGASVVRVLDLRDYSELLVFGRDGEDTEQMLKGPINLALDRDGNCYVADAIRLRVSVFGPDGSFVRNVGRVGDVPGTFSRPKGVAILDDMLLVVDAAFENCQILDLQGQPLMFFGGPGTARGQFYLPAGVWAGREGIELFRDVIDENFEVEAILAVTSFYGPHKVSFFALGKHRDFDYSIYEQAPPTAEEPSDG